MKTPEEIKKGLECCIEHGPAGCIECPYRDGDGCRSCEKNADALAYIQQLEAELEDEKNKNEILIFDNDKLMEEIAQTERERDAAADCIHKVYTTLSKPAKNVTSARDHAVWSLYAMNDYFRNWRGVCEENTKEGTDG